MHLRGIFRSCFTRVRLVFNLDVHCIFCVKLIYFHKTFHLNYVVNVNLIFKIFDLGKMSNLTPKIIIYLLA